MRVFPSVLLVQNKQIVWSISHPIRVRLFAIPTNRRPAGRFGQIAAGPHGHWQSHSASHLTVAWVEKKNTHAQLLFLKLVLLLFKHVQTIAWNWPSRDVQTIVPSHVPFVSMPVVPLPTQGHALFGYPQSLFLARAVDASAATENMKTNGNMPPPQRLHSPHVPQQSGREWMPGFSGLAEIHEWTTSCPVNTCSYHNLIVQNNFNPHAPPLHACALLLGSTQELPWCTANLSQEWWPTCS